MTKLIDPKACFVSGGSSGLAIKHTQEISDEHLKLLAAIKESNDSKPVGDMMPVASIPTVVVEKWMREGFNIWEHKLPEIMARLRMENMGKFILTDKRL